MGSNLSRSASTRRQGFGERSCGLRGHLPKRTPPRVSAEGSVNLVCEDGALVLSEASFQARTTAHYPAASAFFDLAWPRRKERRQWD
jgi:hypothetical protein